MRRRAFFLLIATFISLSACAGGRISHDEMRRQISELGGSRLVPRAVSVQRVVSQGDDRAIAEANVQMAFEFARDRQSGDWKIVAVRLGESQWVPVEMLVTAVNAQRTEETVQKLEVLMRGIQQYQQQNNGTLPAASDIIALTDILHPRFCPELIREDAWGHQIAYEAVEPSSFRLRSAGVDGLSGTPDDIILAERQRPDRP